MKKNNLLVMIAAIINVLLVLALPKYFSGESVSYEPNITERHKAILESVSKGLPITMDDIRYKEQQGELMVLESQKRAKEIFSGTASPKIKFMSVILVASTSLMILIVIAYFGYFRRLGSLVYFLVPSTLILLLSPIASGQLFFIIAANAIIVYLTINILSMKKK